MARSRAQKAERRFRWRGSISRAARLPSGGRNGSCLRLLCDGRPFLVGSKRGAGHVFACATQPDKEWSSLGEGVVLLPMIQRLLALGGQRFSPPAMAIAGEWSPPDSQEIWTPMDRTQRRDWRWQAGIYHSGDHDRSRSIGRPSKTLPEIVERARLPELFRGVKLTVVAGAMELKADSLQSEIWPAMVMVTMAFLSAEMLLATSRAPAARGGPRILQPEFPGHHMEHPPVAWRPPDHERRLADQYHSLGHRRSPSCLWPPRCGFSFQAWRAKAAADG